MRIRQLKSTIAAILLTAMALTCFACGKTEESSYKTLDSATREEVAQIAASDNRLTGELENKTIKWMANWDINPDGTGKNVPIELAIFQERYGGKVETKLIDWNSRFDILATSINANEGIDFFPAGDVDTFPKGAIRGMFQPVDDYIDLDSALWQDVKPASDQLMWDGSHYVIVNAVTGDGCVVIYNRTTIEEANLEDPAKLYAEGKWDWNAFESMLTKFVDPANNKFGIDGWWFEYGLSATCGTPYIGLENGKLVNNLKSESVERVQNWMYDLFKNNCVAIGVGDYGWKEKPNYIGEHKTLFYPCGMWALYKSPEQWQADFGEDCFFVPMPKDPKADTYSIPASIDGYLMVKGGQNPEGVAKFAECKRVTLMNERANTLGTEQLVKDYGWTDEMLKMHSDIDKLALANPYFDYYRGVTKDLESILDSNESGIRAASKGVPWNESLAAIYDQVQAMVDEVNENPVSSQAK